MCMPGPGCGSARSATPLRLIPEFLETLPEGSIARSFRRRPTPAPFPSWKGGGARSSTGCNRGVDGEINRCMVRDPSSVNWLGLEQAVSGEIVPDFPLCNKSFNQSYSGHDL